MAKKRIDLKKRLDALRDAPEAPVDIHLRLDVDLVQTLRRLADAQGVSLEHYVETVLRRHSWEGEG